MDYRTWLWRREFWLIIFFGFVFVDHIALCGSMGSGRYLYNISPLVFSFWLIHAHSPNEVMGQRLAGCLETGEIQRGPLFLDFSFIGLGLCKDRHFKNFLLMGLCVCVFEV